MSKKVSILGCGWLGLPLAKHLIKKGFSLKGATTSEEKLEKLSQSGIKPYLMKFDPSLEGAVQDFFQTELLVVNVPPRSRTKDATYHPQQIRAIIDTIEHTLDTIIYVSSTSIYPREDNLYDETYHISREQSGNKAIFDAEQLVMNAESVKNKYILRSAGQMGLERIPGKYFAGKEIKGPHDHVNYIHQKDLVELLTYVIEEKPKNGIYNLVAPEHPLKKNVVNRSIAKMGFDKAWYNETSEVKKRIIAGDKVIKEWGYEFYYPDPMNFDY